jgi:7,8-dihydropterin-6-yl-methyl-4-(beta-D-ribofuranosyl)aminobenzene 5'-phosphate synthase
MKITTLAENLSYRMGLKSEHGLSFLIEDGDFKVLFDTGQSDLFIHNAKEMGVDVQAISALVLSHGHYDHSGGLAAFCAANARAKIYVGKGFFEPKFGKGGRVIGAVMPLGHEGRFILVDGMLEIAPNLFVIGDVPIIDRLDTHFEGLFVEKDGKVIEDEFSEEQFVCKVDNGSLIVVSGCNHRGITNVAAMVASKFGLPIRLLLGGFHLKDAAWEDAEKVLKTLASFDIASLGSCHCTGVEKYPLVKSAFGNKAFYACAGTVLTEEFMEGLRDSLKG